MRIEKFHHCLLAQNGSLQGQFILKYGPIISNIPSRTDRAEVIGKSTPIQKLYIPPTQYHYIYFIDP